MANDDVEVVIIGGGAAGIAATRRLHDAGIRCLLVEARPRLGGRAFSRLSGMGMQVDRRVVSQGNAQRA